MSIVMYGCRSCNLNCAYCNSIGESEESTSKKDSKFVLDKDKLYHTIMNYPQTQSELKNDEHPKFEFAIWGGNPLLHFKEFKETVAFLEEKFPGCHITTTDNCLSFKSDEIFNYVVSHNIGVQISHDGLGQWIRSGDFDPFKDKKINDHIVQLVKYDLVTSINCLLSAANCSFFENIKYFNKWRWDNHIEQCKISIKLNKVLDSDYELPQINEKGLWNGKVDKNRIGKPIGRISFSYGEELNRYFYEKRQLGLLIRHMAKMNQQSLYFEPYIGWLKDSTSFYQKLTYFDMETNPCQSFQRGHINYNFCLDTKGNYTECDLIDSDFKALHSGGKLAPYCKDCKYKVLKICQNCGSLPNAKECVFKKENARLQEEFFYLDTGQFLFDDFTDISEIIC